MTDEDYFRGFDQSEYEEEARERWGDTPHYAESQKRWASYSAAEREAIKAEGGDILARLVGRGSEASPADLDIQAAAADYYTYINKRFYPCDLAMFRVLSEGWVADPRFTATFDRFREGGATFAREAVQIFCDRGG
jgi:hypothetical protein